jgi:Rieske Fe-S protein
MCHDDHNEKTRRDFINELSLSLAGTLVASHGFGAQERPGALATLKIDEHPELQGVGGHVTVKKTPAGDLLVIRCSETEYAALSVICPHLQCNIKVKSANLIQCPCHQSGYKTDGTYLSGPAKTGLRRFPLTLDNGVITVWPASS